MTKTLVALPCTARELEAALHKVCDHDGLWDAKVYAKWDGDSWLFNLGDVMAVQRAAVAAWNRRSKKGGSNGR